MDVQELPRDEELGRQRAQSLLCCDRSFSLTGRDGPVTPTAVALRTFKAASDGVHDCTTPFRVGWITLRTKRGSK